MFNESLFRSVLSQELGISHELVNLGILGDGVLLVLMVIAFVASYLLKKRTQLQQRNNNINNNNGAFSPDSTVQCEHGNLSRQHGRCVQSDAAAEN